LLVAAAALRGPLPAGAATCKAWLVQSIPTGIPHSLSLYPPLGACARVLVTSILRAQQALMDHGCGLLPSIGD